MRHIARIRWLALSGALWAAAWGGTVDATEVLLKDGRVLRGKLGKTAGVAESPLAKQTEDGGPLQTLIVLDDNLRRMFFSERLIAPNGVRLEEKRQLEEKFTIWQRVLHNGPTIKSVGPPLQLSPFDEFGRRTYTMLTDKGAVPVYQGITELTPQWAKVEGIKHVWDERIATSTIPTETLRRILLKQVDPKVAEDYKKIARFCLQGERYQEARQTLEALVAAFPDQKEDVAQSLRLIEAIVGAAVVVGAKAAARRRPAPPGPGEAGRVSHRGRRRGDPPGRARHDPGV